MSDEITKLLDEMWHRGVEKRDKRKLIAALRRALEFIETSSAYNTATVERDVFAILKGEKQQ